MMKKIRKILFVAAMALLLLSAGSCSRIKGIELLGCGLESFAVRGLRGVDADLSLHIKNPAMQFSISDVSGVLYYQGSPIADYSAEPVKVERRCTAVYSLPCSATLSDGVSVLKVLSLLKNYDIEDFTTDVSAKVTLKNGVSHTFNFKNKPLKELME